MRILVLEPYYGGSHRAFIDSWSTRSEHDFTLCTLPAHHWKWRMRHSALTMAEQVRQHGRTASWDLIFCSDMLNLAEFRGVAPRNVIDLPSIIYFHENQLTYPSRLADERDLHLAFSNFVSAVAADHVWFNSEFHAHDFLDGLTKWFRRMPDHQPVAATENLWTKTSVFPPSISSIKPRTTRASGAMRILWSGRWEYDKNPRLFFDALHRLRDQSVDFRVSVVGESFRTVPDEFSRAHQEFADRIDHWGYLTSRSEYEQALRNSDVYVSTAHHEFFGIAAAEAINAGAFPVVPNRLAYPGLINPKEACVGEQYFYDGSASTLCRRLQDLASMIESGVDLRVASEPARAAVSRFHHDVQIPERDREVNKIVGLSSSG